MDSSIKAIVIGIAGMLSLVTAIVIFILFYQRRVISHQQQLKKIEEQKEKDLTEAAIKAEEDERSRIAAELHDDVGAMLASVKLNFHQAEEDGSGSAAFDQSHRLIEETIDKVRKMSRSLQPAMLQHLGLSRALRAFFDIFPENGPVKMHYNASALPQLHEHIALGIYRIVQELVNNALKHANAKEIWLEHETGNDVVIFRFVHNGRGITEDRFQEYIYKKDATGLKNIINRLKVLNGSISFSNDGETFYTIIQIPL